MNVQHKQKCKKILDSKATADPFKIHKTWLRKIFWYS